MTGLQRTGFVNDQVRIGPPSVNKESFLIALPNGKERKGKRFEIPEYLKGLGLNAFEFSAGRMANFSNSPEIEQFAANIQKYDIASSIHAPYYISLTSESDETFNASIERIANVYAWAVYLNAKRIVLHPGTYGKLKQSPQKSQKTKGLDQFLPGKKTIESHPTNAQPFSELLDKIVEGIKEGIKRSKKKYPSLQSEFSNICICPETMGKHGQLGTLEEVIHICKELGPQIARPCIDFGHLYARYLGKIPEEKLYKETFDKVEKELGNQVVQSLHIHYSHIAFTPKGEKEHVPNSDPQWGPKSASLFRIIHENGYTPIIINESPELESDAKLLMNEWQKIHQKQ